MRWTVEPARRLRGEVRVPGDKSIAHRALLLASIAEEASDLAGLPEGDDVLATLELVGALGIRCSRHRRADGLAVQVGGKGLSGLAVPAGRLDCRNSGTTMRLGAGLLAAQPFESVLTGDASLRRRPMRRIAEPLRAMGAQLELSPAETAPIRVAGPAGRLRAIVHRPEVASAQVKSCVLLAGLYADGRTAVEEPLPTRDHSERLLAAMGAEVEVVDQGSGRLVTIEPEPRLAGLSGRIPGDISSAAYWLVAAALRPGSELVVRSVGLNPSRAAIVDLLTEWGAALDVELEADWYGEPVGTLRVAANGRPLGGGVVDASRVPALIDELPLLAALAPFTENGVEIHGAAELRVKESDRIATMAAALRALGADVDEFPDGLVVSGRQGLRGGTVQAAGDHRIALALAAVAVAADGPVIIEGAEAMRISYPAFYTELEEAVER